MTNGAVLIHIIWSRLVAALICTGAFVFLAIYSVLSGVDTGVLGFVIQTVLAFGLFRNCNFAWNAIRAFRQARKEGIDKEPYSGVGSDRD